MHDFYSVLAVCKIPLILVCCFEPSWLCSGITIILDSSFVGGGVYPMTLSSYALRNHS